MPSAPHASGNPSRSGDLPPMGQEECLPSAPQSDPSGWLLCGMPELAGQTLHRQALPRPRRSLEASVSEEGSARPGALSWALQSGLRLVTDLPGDLPASRVTDSYQELLERPRLPGLHRPRRPRTAAMGDTGLLTRGVHAVASRGHG